MLHSARNDDKFAFFNPFVALAELHAEAAFHDQEHFVFVLVMMKHELALQFVELHVLAIQFGGDVGLPVFGNLGEFIGDIDFVHDGTLSLQINSPFSLLAKDRPRNGLTKFLTEYIMVYIMKRTAKLFQNGRSQAVRLPVEYRFEGSEVYVHRDPATGDVVLSRRPESWEDFFTLVKSIGVPEEFLADRKDLPAQKRRLF
jgi:antitoxin VapB